MPEQLPLIQFYHGVAAGMSAPMLSGDRAIGVLGVHWRSPRAFDPAQAQLLAVMANLAAQALERARLFEATRRQVAELAVLHAVAVAGSQAESEDALIERATQVIGDSLYPDNFGVLLLDEAAQALRLHPSYRGINETILSVPVGTGITGGVAAGGRAWRVPDVRREPAYLDTDPHTCSELCVPLK